MDEQTQKLTIYLAFGVFIIAMFYVVTDSVGLAPQVLKDIATWLCENQYLVSFLFCFVLTVYVLLKR